MKMKIDKSKELKLYKRSDHLEQQDDHNKTLQMNYINSFIN